MPNTLDEHTTTLIKNLIRQISGFQDGTPAFKGAKKYVLHNIQMADSLYFSNRIEVDRIIESLGHKFTLHGFTSQAKQLKHFYEKLVPASLKREELAIRLNIVKFLLGVSQSPTNNFRKYCGNFRSFECGDGDDVIVDWSSYLQEGIPRWSPPPDESSDSWTDSSNSIIEDEDVADYCNRTIDKTVAEQPPDEGDVLLLYHNSKSSLSKSVQSDWFNCTQITVKPLSQDRDANIAILWENFINNKTWGLLSQSNPSILSEYQVMREIIWQFYQSHSSTCFSLVGNKIVPSESVTISSVRSRALQAMLLNFVPYINWLEVFRDFNDSLIKSRSHSSAVPPDTYRSYNFAIQSILKPLFSSLKSIEDNIKDQEETRTLLTLAKEIQTHFFIIKILHNIHSKVILDFKCNSSLLCATTLLWRLRNGLLYTSSKMEHDLYLALYLHSLYKYLAIINSWFSRDEFVDHTGEFVISEKTEKGEQDWHMEFLVKDFNLTPSDGILDIICTQVLQIGKNIHLLRLLGKLHLLPELTGKSSETLYTAFIRRVLEKITDFFNPDEKNCELPIDISITNSEASTFIFPAICPDGCKYFTEMDKLENLVDTTDGFLLKAFESFFVKKPEFKTNVQEKSLYDRISEITTSFFPAYQIVEDVLLTVLKERYRISGIMVKNVLINDYDLKKQFSFLKHVFLFEDDIIFPVYRHIFDELDIGSIWANRAHLTSHFQDIIMDLYPNFYDECIIEIKDSCKYTKDPLKACRMVNINYKIPWPVNIILRDEHIVMYKELFQFILTIKWALYTLNHMYFSELEPRSSLAKKQLKSVKYLTERLKILRFGLVNVFSSIQHYILGHIFAKHLVKFTKAFDEAYDLESLIASHSDFIGPLYKECIALRDYNSSNHGIYLLLYVVTELRVMWRNLVGINQEQLNKCVEWYFLCQQTIDPILNPTSYSNFVSKV